MSKTELSGHWFYVGTADSFPDIATSSGAGQRKLTGTASCMTSTAGPATSTATDEKNRDHAEYTQLPACRVFRLSLASTSPDQLTEATTSAALPTSESKISSNLTAVADCLTHEEAQTTVGLESQVMVFRYRNKFHAVDHQCPHRSYPLSNGSLHDIEDFGIVLSAGITCPKHGWAFDLYTGESDRGSYQLGVWEVQLRKKIEKAGESGSGGNSDGRVDDFVEEIWVRKS